jgi:hypothetical protein
MRPALAIAAGAILLGLALALTAPATLLDRRIDALSAGRLRLANAAGTLWRGSGEIVLLPSGTRLPVAWRAELWPLFRGELHATIGVDAGTPDSVLVLGNDRLDVRDLEVSLPAESVVRAAGPALPLAARGDLALRVERLVQRPDLGRGAVITGTVRNTGGEVELVGQVGVGAAGTLQLTATLRPRSNDRERAEQIAASLAAIGSRDGQGGYTVNLKGSWR